MENKTYTVNEVLDITIRNLYAIRVPVELIEQIGMPISQCIGNLKSVVEALNQPQIQEQKTDEQKDQEEAEDVIADIDFGGEQDGAVSGAE